MDNIQGKGNIGVDFRKDEYDTQDLLSIMRFLRSPQGCPWDREQTHDSIKTNAVEEAYEVVDAINSKRSERICDELGDLLLQVVFHSQIAEEEKTFCYKDVVRNICEKLISRHTHLFGDEQDQADSAEEVLALWEKNKTKEKKHTDAGQILDDIPRSFPALLRAYKIQKKAVKKGFELTDFHNSGTTTEDIIGDKLFDLVNQARLLDIDPEIALDKANNRFIQRIKAAGDDKAGDNDEA